MGSETGKNHSEKDEKKLSVSNGYLARVSELEQRLIEYLVTVDDLQTMALGHSYKAALKLTIDHLEQHPQAESPTISMAISLIGNEMRNAQILEQTKGMVVQA